MKTNRQVRPKCERTSSKIQPSNEADKNAVATKITPSVNCPDEIPEEDNFWPPAEFKVLRLRDCPVDSPQCDEPEYVAAFWRKHIVATPWFNPDKECLCVFLLNTRRHLMGYELASMGILDTLLFHAREVFRLAIMLNAHAIVVAHNHPSGDPTPSAPDVKVTRDMIRAGQLLNLHVLDHVVIGQPSRRCRSGYKSLREMGYFYL